MNRVYGVLFLALIVFLVITSLYVSNNGPMLLFTPGTAYTLMVLAVGLVILALPLAWAYPQRLVKRINPQDPFPQRMDQYRNALIIRFVIVATTGLLVSMLFLLTGDNNLIMILAIILLFFIISRPSPFKTEADLGLKEEERKQLL